MIAACSRSPLFSAFSGVAVAFAVSVWPLGAAAQVTPFKQAVAEAAAGDQDIAAFYQARGYEDLWTGRDDEDRRRREQFVRAASRASDHGLPAGRYDPETIRGILDGVTDERARGRAEVALAGLYLRYARDIQTGILTPSRVDADIKREVPLRSRAGLLEALAAAPAAAAFRALPPDSVEYVRLMKEKLALESVLAAGGWGPTVPGTKIEVGDRGPSVVALRNRLIRMGYVRRTAAAVYDQRMRDAVAQFQADHGLLVDGVPGPDTLGEINAPVEDRLASILVAMERERWLNLPEGRGDRHVWVNLPDYRVRIYDAGKITFETKSVVGAQLPEKRSPEFSDMMEYLEINPDWTVPRSILGRDYLPKFKANPFASPYLELIDARGRVVPREYINFAQYTEKTFPFTVRQPPGRENALGTVKFMFPNAYAIYLHDTPARELFGREVRTFSSGCIRLNDPHDFAYVILARQVADPEPYFQNILQSRRQTIVPLDTAVPVHIDYRTAFTEPKGRVQYRRDMYGRDARIWTALQESGVVLRAVRG